MATVSKSSVAALEVALDMANNRYDGNLIFNATGSNYHRGEIRPRGGTVLAFSISVASSRGPGHRVTAGNGRRLRAACWHAWRDFLAALFELNPQCTVRTSLATYRGRDGFQRDFPATFHHNHGSLLKPHEYGTLCECRGTHD